ncbi:MAG: DNA polymerase III subunit gamma/tau [Armatimonadetes bacterium]|nr:DNA polymerase III subunit gamma/tau [Armatimonadota bacterium]
MAEAATLYNKYRPDKFADAGQSIVVRVLQSQLASGRFPAAYLLQGPAGCGKTTIARIMAAAMVCQERGDSLEPCGVCKNCCSVKARRHRDVIEENCADNSGIDDVRTIIDERLRIAPSVGDYRVFILDEVQRLSRDAQGAMLKHLEEPPPHVKFFLCTSEPDKLLHALQTRCQRHVIKPFSTEALTALLVKVATAEGVEVDEDGLTMLAESSSGSARQGLVYLEHALELGGTGIEQAAQVLGRGPSGLCRDLLLAVVECQDVSLVRMADVVKSEGLDRSAVFEECLRILTNIQRAMVLGEDLAAHPIQGPVAAKYKRGSLNAVSQFLVDAVSKMRGGAAEEALFQLTLLRASEFIRTKRAEAKKPVEA